MVAVSALRSALGAIGNAEAIPSGTAPAAVGSLHLAGAVAGIGAAEAERRSLSESEVGEIVRAEIAERQIAVREYEQSGHADRASRLRREMRILIAATGSRMDS